MFNQLTGDTLRKQTARLLIILSVVVNMLCGCLEGPIEPQGEQGPEGLPGTSEETPIFYLTALSGNGQTLESSESYISHGNSVQFSVLVANLYGVPIERCRIDWTVIEGDGDFKEYLESKEDIRVHHTGNDGVSNVNVYPNSFGTMKVRATIFATGEYVEFVAVVE